MTEIFQQKKRIQAHLWFNPEKYKMSAKDY